jgi:aldose 1-epimerase
MRLACGAWELDLLPALGGAIAALRRDGADIFRPTPHDAQHPLEAACFPLVPYANRIADGRFSFEGERYVIPRNVADQAHPLHGTGWLQPWTVEQSDERSATLHYRHGADDGWPWAHHAEQRIVLGDEGLHVTLSLTNTGDRAMPFSLGLHPYFTKAGVSCLRFDAERMWLIDDAFLPTEPAPADRLGDWAAGETVERTSLIDNSYEGWSGTATISRNDGDLRLAGTNTPFLHVFTPPGEPYFCVEPVTAMPDAFNRAVPAVLQPGESHAITMTLTAE